METLNLILRSTKHVLDLEREIAERVSERDKLLDEIKNNLKKFIPNKNLSLLEEIVEKQGDDRVTAINNLATEILLKIYDFNFNGELSEAEHTARIITYANKFAVEVLVSQVDSNYYFYAVYKVLKAFETVNEAKLYIIQSLINGTMKIRKGYLVYCN